jgi:WD40 repeat protein
VAFSPDGKASASGTDDGAVWLWDATAGASKLILEGHSGWVSAVAFSTNGKVLASASGDKTVRLWDATTGTPKQTLETNAIIESLLFSEGSRYLKTNRGLLA